MCCICLNAPHRTLVVGRQRECPRKASSSFGVVYDKGGPKVKTAHLRRLASPTRSSPDKAAVMVVDWKKDGDDEAYTRRLYA
jgi:hypothetical protein